MTAPTVNAATPPRNEKPLRPPGRPLGMHADVPTWCDCCSCEPEPRWQAVEEPRHQRGAGEDHPPS